MSKKENKQITEELVVAEVATAPVVSKQFKNYLENRKVQVKAIESSGKWGNLLVNGEERKKDPFLFNKAKRSFQVPYNRMGGLVKILDNYEAHYTPQFPTEKLTEQTFFEKLLGTDLNLLKDSDNFWKSNNKSRVILTKDGLQLDLSEPLDMIKYKILMVQDNICKNYETRFNGNFEFAIVDENKLVSKRLEESKTKAEAYIKLSEVMASEVKMINFVKASGKHVPARTTAEWLKDQIITSLEDDYIGFLNIVTDELFEDRVFIYDAVKAGAVVKVSSKTYALDNGMTLGDITDAIHYFRDPEHQELKFRVQSQIDRINS